MIGIAEIQAPAWLGETPDAWLKTQIKKDSSWDIAVSAGMTFRLEQEPPAEEIKTIVKDLLAGKPSNSWAHVAVWAWELKEVQHRALEALAIAEEELIFDLLQDIRRNYDPECPGWQSDVLSLFHRRDDLACILVVLREGKNRGRRLITALRSLDEDCKAFVAALPQGLTWKDERLSRIRKRCHNSWWASRSAA